MMKRVTALVGITVLAILAGCAKKEAPAASAPAGEDDVATAVQSAPAATTSAPVVERSKSASEMIALIDPAPQCQQYRDELAAKGQTTGTMDELNEILVRAYQAGCGKPRAPKQ